MALEDNKGFQYENELNNALKKSGVQKKSFQL